MLQPQNITEYFISTHVKPGDIAIDATAGNGNDTLKLCRAVGETGKVYAFDIQKCALENTREKLDGQNLSNYTLICDSHSELDRYVEEKVKCVIFNLGYLPGGDHSVCTKAESTTAAIEKSLGLISPEGFISVTVYYGKNSGTQEKEAVMQYFKGIDHKRFTVIVHDFYNRPNNPPLTVIITPKSSRRLTIN